MWPFVTGFLQIEHVFKVHPRCMYQSFISFNWQTLFHCMDMSRFIHSSLDGRLDYFHLLAILDAAMNIVYKFLKHTER